MVDSSWEKETVIAGTKQVAAQQQQKKAKETDTYCDPQRDTQAQVQFGRGREKGRSKNRS